MKSLKKQSLVMESGSSLQHLSTCRFHKPLGFHKILCFKEKHIKKVQSCVVTSTAECSPEGDSENDSSYHLSISFESSGITTIAQSMLQNMCKKPENLVNSKNHVLTAPWLSDNKARLVKSNSSNSRIISTHQSNNIYCCDDKCAMLCLRDFLCVLMFWLLLSAIVTSSPFWTL